MKPNWLVFMLRLSTGDTIYVQYLVPTLIMSRQSDQLPKVMSLDLAMPHNLHHVDPSPTASRQSDSGPKCMQIRLQTTLVRHAVGQSHV